MDVKEARRILTYRVTSTREERAEARKVLAGVKPTKEGAA